MWKPCIVLVVACGSRQPRIEAATAAPDAAVDPCSRDGSVETARGDAFSFEGDIIEGCLLHPEGIID